jgi:adenylylsulfate kinase
MSDVKATNIVWHEMQIAKSMRERLSGHRGIVVWFTGLPSAGKSTVANVVDAMLYERKARSFVLDGDNVRHGLNKNLGFSPADREENIRRIGEVAKLFSEAGIITLTAFISPYRNDRERVRALVAPGAFVEVFVDAPVAICEERDPKGLYKKAREGIVKEFTGVSAPYEPPLKPEIRLDSEKRSPMELAQEVMAYFEKLGVFTL